MAKLSQGAGYETQICKVNQPLRVFYKQLNGKANFLLHLRVAGTMPYLLPKLNYDYPIKGLISLSLSQE